MHMHDDIYERGLRLGLDRSDVQHYLRLAERFPDHARRGLDRLLEDEGHELNGPPDPFEPWPNADDLYVPDSLRLGVEAHTDVAAYVGRSELQNVLIIGMNRSGKTNLLRLLASQIKKPDMFWGIDEPRSGLSSLALDPPGCRYILKENLAISLFEPPPGMAEKQWDERVARILGAVWRYQLAGTLFLFDRMVETRRRVKEQNRAPSVADLEQTYLDYRPVGQAQAELRSRTLYKLRALREACTELNFQHGIDLAYFIRERESVLFQVREEDEIRSLYVLFLLYYSLETLLHHPEWRTGKTFLIADECTHAFGLQSSDDGQPLSGKLATLFAGAGGSLILASQVVSRILPEVRANSSTFVFRNSDIQVFHCRQLQNLDPEQAAEIPNFPTGRCLMRVPGPRLKGPVLVDVELFCNDGRQVTDEELRAISEASVKDLQADIVGPVEPATMPPAARRDPGALSADAHRFIIDHESNPMILRLHDEQLRFSATKRSRVLNELNKNGMYVWGPVVGRNNKTVLPTDKLRAYCQDHNIRIPREQSGSQQDRVHLIMHRTFIFIISKLLPGARFQIKGTAYQVGPSKQRRVDGLLFPPRGWPVVGYNIGWKNAPGYEADALIELAAAPLGPDFLLMIAHSAAHADAIKQAMDRVLFDMLDAEAIAAKIKRTTLDEVIDGKIDLAWLGGPAA